MGKSEWIQCKRGVKGKTYNIIHQKSEVGSLQFFVIRAFRLNWISVSFFEHRIEISSTKYTKHAHSIMRSANIDEQTRKLDN